VVPVTVLARVYIVGRAFLGIVVVLPAAHGVRILVLIVARVLDIERLLLPVVVVAPARVVLPAAHP